MIFVNRLVSEFGEQLDADRADRFVPLQIVGVRRVRQAGLGDGL